MQAFTATINRFFGFTLLGIFAGLLGIFALLALSLENEYRGANRQAAVEVENISRLLEAHVLETVHKSDLLLLELRRNLGPGDLRPAGNSNNSRRRELDELLKSQKDSVPEVEAILIADAQGNLIYSSLAPVPEPGIANRGDFQRHRQGNTAGLLISPPFQSGASGKWTMMLSRRLDFADGGFAGMAAAVLDMTYFHRFFQTLDLGANGMVALYDTEMHLAARFPPREKDMGKTANLHLKTYIDKGIKHASYFAASPLDGVERLHGFRQVGDLPLIVIAGGAKVDYLGQWRRHVWQYSAGGLLLLLIGAVFGWRLWRKDLALAESEENFRAILDYTYDWEYLEGPAHELLFISPSCERVTGYTQAEFQSDPDLLLRIIHPDDRRLIIEHPRDAVNEDFAMLDFRIVRRDGEIRWINHGCRPAFGRDAKLLGWRASNRDITERMAADAKLRQFKAIVDSTDDAIIGKTLSGIINSWNRGAERIFGYTAAEAIGQPILQLIPPDRRDEESEILGRIARGERVEHFETVRCRKDGVSIDISATISPIQDQDGKPIGASKIARDITERKKIEAALREAKQAAENANSAKSEFLANMSHEIRTPMNAIIGLANLGLGLELPPKPRDYFTKIHTSSKALLAIINDILDYSKIEAGRLEFDTLEFSLEEVLENSANLFNIPADEKGLELMFRISPEIPPKIIGDPMRLGQVINNLLGNAVKFTESGEIYILIEQIAATPERIGLRFSIRDSGIGISPERIQQLFTPFTQADSSITRKYGGTGLGLTISKRLVERMGGEIAVSSEPGKGSIFSFILGFAVPRPPAIPGPPAGLRGMHVLVVDDMELSRDILAELLGRWKFRIAAAASGPAALDYLDDAFRANDRVELILLDWKMPEMDGVEAARRIHRLAERHGVEHPPLIVMVTAHGQDKLMAAAGDLRLDAVLNKPVTPSGLFDAINLFQDGQQRTPLSFPAAEPAMVLSGAAGARILLVEDNEINQQVARELLQRYGLQTTVAGNGNEALQCLSRETFDAVLMDLQMPELDGFATTRRIRELPGRQGLPIIAMTAAAMTGDREACLAAGMNDHVAKPIDPRLLMETLARWIKAPARCPAPACETPESRQAWATLAEKLPGFDLNDIMRILDGDQARYQDMLRDFAGRFGGEAKLVAELIGQGDYIAAADRLHNLKGVAGNLGARRLHRFCEDLNQELARDRANPDVLVRWRDCCDGVMAALAELPNRTLTGKTTEAGGVLAELRDLLSNDGFIRDELLYQLKSLAPADRQTEYQSLAQAIQATDYPLARAILYPLLQAYEHN